MSKEVLSLTPKESKRRKIVPKVLRSALAGSLLSVACTAGSCDLANSSQEILIDNFSSAIESTTPNEISASYPIEIFPEKDSVANVAYISPFPQNQETKSKNERISNLLKNNFVRTGLATALSMAVSTAVGAYKLGKRHDEAKLHALRVAGPLFMVASTSTALIDSFITVDRNIPASLFLISTLLIASHQIINTFQHYKDRKIRASAVSTAAMFTSLGVTVLVALNK